MLIRKGSERGQSNNSWLHSLHTFSFAEYHDPQFMHFGSLRVINEDIVQPKMGFGRHPHRDMEIITYVISGKLAHKDSMGTGSIILPGEIQCMSAGTGIEHSEFNQSSTDPVHLLQIWILPEKHDLKPRYQQQSIPKEINQLVLIGSNEGGLIHINQDVKLYLARFAAEQSLTYPLAQNRRVWLQMIKGEITLNGHHLVAGDGVGLRNDIDLKTRSDTEFLLFDLT